MGKIERCHLNAVQLHGQESPQIVRSLRKENILVIKALFIKGRPSLEDASKYEASAYLVECGQGKLPGGNALAWNWKAARDFGKKYPFILAGGLAPENIYSAVNSSAPDAVDISSGVESAAGQKDLDKVASFMDAISRCHLSKKIRRIF